MADGTLIIDAESNTDGVEVGMRDIEASVKRMASTVGNVSEKTRIAIKKQADAVLKLNNQCSQQEKKVESLKQRLKELSDQKIKTDTYKQLEREIENVYEKSAKVEAELNGWRNLGVPENSSGFKAKEKELQEIWDVMDKLEEKQKKMRESGTAYVDPRSLSEYQKTASKLATEEMRMDDMNNRLSTSFDSVKEKVRECGDAMNGLKSKEPILKKLQKALERLSPELAKKGFRQLGSSIQGLARNVEKLCMKMLKLSASSIAGGIRKISAGIFGIHKSANKSTTSVGTMTKAVKALLKYGIGIRALNLLMGRLRSAAVEGFQNLAQYSGTTNNSISMLMSSLTQLKNALAAAFNPILTVVAPILAKFINLLSQALTYVGMFFAALTGQKTFTKATSVQQNYADSLDKTADSAKKATKALKGYLSPIDEINNYDSGNDDSSTDGTGGGGYSNPTPGQMFEEVPIKNSIKGLADKIKKLIQQEDWEGLGKFMAQGINKGLKHVYNAINWKKVGPKVTKFCNAFTRTFNSLVDNIDWDLLGQTVGAGVNTIVNTLNLLITGIDWKNLGKKFAEGITGFVREVNWKNLGNLLGNQFMISCDIFNGMVHNLPYGEIGKAFADLLNGTFEKVSFGEIADTLATGLNGAFDSLYEFTTNFEWTDLVDNIADGINTFIGEFKWEENGQKLEAFLEDLCSSLVDFAEKTDWEELGRNIGDFLSRVEWKKHLKQVIYAIRKAIKELFDGLEEGGTAGKIVAFFGKAFLAVKVAHILGIDSLVGSLVSHIGSKLLEKGAVSALSGSLTDLISGGLSGAAGGFGSLAASMAPLVGTAGLIAAVAGGAVLLTKKLASLTEAAQGGNGILSQTGGYLHDYTGAMSEAHAITQDQAEELWKLIEADESAGKANNEMYDDFIQKLSEYGVSADKAKGILEQYGAQAGVSADFVGNMTAKVKELGAGFSETTGKIDTSSITTKEAIKGIRDVLYDLGISSSEYAGTYQGVLSAFNNTSGAATTAQEAFDIVYNSLKDAGVPLDELNKALAEKFPTATATAKASVDSNITEAQKTVSSSTSKMKSDAESNLAGVKKAAEDASDGVNTATVTKWGNSATEVKKNLDQMKQTANLKLGEMQKTVESHFSSQYNTMTKKWEKASEKISQIIVDMNGMINRKMESLVTSMEQAGTRMGNKLSEGFSTGSAGIAGTLNNMITRINQTISNINGAISDVERAFSFSYNATGPTGKSVHWNSSMSLPRVNPVPFLASGAVIPPRSEFLAVLGDQKQGNNIETPEALLRKIVREETPQRQNGNTYNVSVEASGRRLLDIILEEGELRRSRNGGKNPFKLGEE